MLFECDYCQKQYNQGESHTLIDCVDHLKKRINALEANSRPTQRAGDVCHACGAKLPTLTRQCVVCGTRA